MSESDGTNIVEFSPRSEELRDSIGRRYSHRSCRHAQTWLDVAERELTCQACEKIVDPYDFLARLCNRFESEKRQERTAREVEESIGRILKAGGSVSISPSGTRVKVGRIEATSRTEGGILEQLKAACDNFEWKIRSAR